MTYTETEALSRQDMAIYRLAVRLCSDLPLRNPEGNYYRCHEIARAAQVHISLWFPEYKGVVEDGFWRKSYQHSWVRIGPEVIGLPLPRVILDVAAIASYPPVQIVDDITRSYTKRSIEVEFRQPDIDRLVDIMKGRR